MKWVKNKKTGNLESTKLITKRRKETIKNCVITIFIVLFSLSVITNIKLVKENKYLSSELELYQGQPDCFLIQE